MTAISTTIHLPAELWRAVQLLAPQEGDVTPVVLRALEDSIARRSKHRGRRRPGKYQQLVQALSTPMRGLRLSARPATALQNLNIRYPESGVNHLWPSHSRAMRARGNSLLAAFRLTSLKMRVRGRELFCSSRPLGDDPRLRCGNRHAGFRLHLILVQQPPVNLFRLPNFGEKSLREIQTKLKTLGFSLGMTLETTAKTVTGAMIVNMRAAQRHTQCGASFVGHRMPNPAEAFEAWLLHRVAHAVEAGEVSADLLSALHQEMEAARELPPAEGHAVALQEIAKRLDVPVERIEHLLAVFEARPTVTRQLLLRRLVEAWLEGEREAYRAHGLARESDVDP